MSYTQEYHDDIHHPEGTEPRVIEPRAASAAKAAAEAERRAAMTPTERRLEELRRAGSDLYLRGDDPRQKAAMAEVRRLIAADVTPEEAAARADMTIDELRAEYGLAQPTFFVPQMAERWDVGWEADFLDYAHARGWSPDIVRDAIAFYVERGQATMGDFSPDDVALFHSRFRSRLSQAERDKLVRFAFEDVAQRRIPR